MKALIFRAVLAGVLVSVTGNSAAQGTLNFVNSPSSIVYSNSTVASGNPTATGMKVALYYSTDTNNFNPASFTFLPSSVTNLGTGLGRGRFNGGVKAIPNAAPGSFINAVVCVWPTSYPSWESVGGFQPYCRQEIVKGRSSPFRIGPLGTSDPDAAPLTNLPSIGVGVSLATPLCDPLVQAIAGPNTFRLRIDLNGSSTCCAKIGIECTTSLSSTNWQVLTNFYGPPPYTNTVFFWTDPNFTNPSPRFYRVRASWN
jgi:hypothetical protein